MSRETRLSRGKTKEATVPPGPFAVTPDGEEISSQRSRGVREWEEEGEEIKIDNTDLNLCVALKGNPSGDEALRAPNLPPFPPALYSYLCSPF